MDVQELIRAQSMSAVVLIGGCDKTVPAQIMGALSTGLPAIQLVAGPMMTGRYHAERLGACNDCRKYCARYRAGETSETEIADIEYTFAVSDGAYACIGSNITTTYSYESLRTLYT